MAKSNITSFLNHILGKIFLIVASAASILSIFLLCFDNQYHAYIALGFIIAFLVAVLLKIFYFLDKYMQGQCQDGYEKFAVSVFYQTKDGKVINYEVYKNIHCKQFIMDEHRHGYSWSGTNAPLISSDNMKLETVIKGLPGDYDYAVFKFPKPLTYNNYSIVHIKMQLDDTDKRSNPHVEQRVIERMLMLHFKVELNYKTASKFGIAKLLKKRLNNKLDKGYEMVEPLTFNVNNSSYETRIYDPEPNCMYRVEWER